MQIHLFSAALAEAPINANAQADLSAPSAVDTFISHYAKQSALLAAEPRPLDPGATDDTNQIAEPESVDFVEEVENAEPSGGLDSEEIATGGLTDDAQEPATLAYRGPDIPVAPLPVSVGTQSLQTGQTTQAGQIADRPSQRSEPPVRTTETGPGERSLPSQPDGRSNFDSAAVRNIADISADRPTNRKAALLDRSTDPSAGKTAGLPVDRPALSAASQLPKPAIPFNEAVALQENRAKAPQVLSDTDVPARPDAMAKGQAHVAQNGLSNLPVLGQPTQNVLPAGRAESARWIPVRSEQVEITSVSAKPGELYAQNGQTGSQTGGSLARPTLNTAPVYSTLPGMSEITGGLQVDINNIAADPAPASFDRQASITPTIVAGASKIPIPQVIEVMMRTAERRVDISMQPEELGRVRMSLQTGDGGLNLVVQAERAETVELMRRHIDQLASELRRLGFGDVGFEFHHQSPGNSQGKASGDLSYRDAEDDAQFENGLVASADSTAEPVRTTGLDLRL